MSLYRKYRPQNFASVVGQKPAVDVLTNSIAKSRVGHAYLFSGSRGCGKTSVARIFAKALNCLERENFEPCGHCRNCTDITAGESLDVIEIDGASNNGVENIRGLKENVTLAPFSSRYKIYIIDEVHMLSQGAFNALLKTLEEPPEHVIFILATTEPHKVPVTIRSRCQHIPFHSIKPEDIFARLSEVCTLENITSEPEALWEIARQSEGALRDALSLLEQVTAAGDVTLANVESVFGAGSRPAFERWIVNLRESPENAYSSLKAMFDAGASGVRVFEEMFSLVRNLWLVAKWPGIVDNIGASESERKFLQDESKQWKPEKLHSLLHVIMRALTNARSGMRADILLGVFMLYLEGEASREVFTPPPTVIAKIPEFVPAPPPPPPLTVEEDTELKEKLLNIAHEKDFTIYCALFDAKPHTHNGALYLDMEHAYSYETLRIDRTSAELAGMFGDFGKVILRYGASESVCVDFVPENVTIEAPTKKHKTKPETLTAPSEAPAPKQETAATSSVFSSYINALRHLQAKPEIILVKHKEHQDDSDDNTDDSTTEEGDNE